VTAMRVLDAGDIDLGTNETRAAITSRFQAAEIADHYRFRIYRFSSEPLGVRTTR